MFKRISHFKSYITCLLTLACCSLPGGCRPATGERPLPDAEGYLVLVDKEATDEDIFWARYLYDHLVPRSSDPEAVAYGIASRDMFPILVDLNPELEYDFKIENRPEGLRLSAPDKVRMLWLQYQFISALGSLDERISVNDLPPAVLSLRDTAGSFAFEYRGLYSPTNLDPDYPGLAALDNADAWGLWGHNLARAVGKNPSGEVYATVDGEKTEEQFCFSSEALYLCLENYVVDNYGEEEGKPARFVIAPNDNAIACTCKRCLKAGNTPGNATPAVTKLVTRLAKRFPTHYFFTTAYLSTREAPKASLPENAGVILSAIDLPLRIPLRNEPAEKAFVKQLEAWKKVTKRIYVWDYINNFDDYLTPFPVLEIAAERLRFFRREGVRGLFLNGSGYDYSSFDDLKTYVLGALLLNPDFEAADLARAFFHRNYPASERFLYDYYMSLENKARTTKKGLNLYAGIGQAENAFLDAREFVAFYDRLIDLPPKSSGPERKKLEALLTALSFTRLEIARTHGADSLGYASRQGNALEPKAGTKNWLTQLGEYKAFPTLERYRESGGEIGTYLLEWEKYILEGSHENLLLGKAPQAVSALDEGYGDLSVLTDGVPGLPDNYHCGWHISSAQTLEIGLPLAGVSGARTFRMTFLHDSRHGILPPEKVDLYKDGAFYKSCPVTDGDSVATAQETVELSGTNLLTIKATRPEGKKVQLGVDEIRLLP